MTVTYDVLSDHVLEATFERIEKRPCRFRTSECPDRCGHSKETAVFTVTNYISYSKPGQYGDEKQEVVHFALFDGEGTEKQDPAIIAKVRALTPGAKVKIHYEHRYVTSNGSKWPERPFVSLEQI